MVIEVWIVQADDPDDNVEEAVVTVIISEHDMVRPPPVGSKKNFFCHIILTVYSPSNEWRLV